MNRIAACRIMAVTVVSGSVLLAGCFEWTPVEGNDTDSAGDVAEAILVDGYDTVSTDAPGEASRVDTDRPGVPAPALAQADRNPGSPSFEDERTLADESGKVVLVYFANYT